MNKTVSHYFSLLIRLTSIRLIHQYLNIAISSSKRLASWSCKISSIAYMIVSLFSKWWPHMWDLSLENWLKSNGVKSCRLIQTVNGTVWMVALSWTNNSPILSFLLRFGLIASSVHYYFTLVVYPNYEIRSLHLASDSACLNSFVGWGPKCFHRLLLIFASFRSGKSMFHFELLICVGNSQVQPSVQEIPTLINFCWCQHSWTLSCREHACPQDPS